MRKVIIGILAVVVALGIIAPLTFAGPGDGPGQVGKYSGTVKNIDYTAKNFDLVGEKNYTVVYTEDTKFVKDGNEVKDSDLKNEEKVLVSGPLSEDGKTINAHLVAWGALPGKGDGPCGRQPVVKGIIDKLNLNEKKFDLKANDLQGNEIVFNVTYTDLTKFFRDLNPVKPEDFKNGEKVAVRGKINIEEKKIEALAVFYGKLPEPPCNRRPHRFLKNAIRGEVSEIDYNKKEFTLTPKDKDSIKVKYEDWTDFIKDGKFVFSEELKNGDNVNVCGPLNEETNTVDAHCVIWGKILRNIQRDRGRNI